MKIGILTLHRANNYGAALQCYALQRTLQSLGYDAWVIDYRQPDTERSYRPFQWNSIRQHILSPKLLCKDLTIRPLLAILRQISYNRFRGKYFRTTQPVRHATDMPQNFDVYLIGSDQLWSIQCLDNNIEPVYFGEFLHFRDSRIDGYAISSNIESLETIGKEKLSQYLKNFHVLSVREKTIAEYILQETGFKTRIDIDPTLLVDSAVWEAITPRLRVRGGYVLTYFLLPEQRKYAAAFARRFGLRIIEVGKVAMSPTDFLAYVKHATYIIGGSFHIAVFSIVFQKNFFIIKKNNGFDVRSASLLSNLHLENRMIEAEDLPHVDVSIPADFVTASAAIIALREQSVKYLGNL